ncbi:MAG: polysaccharide pyruvyl transferase family protein [Candidatus Onthoplasma sp.]
MRQKIVSTLAKIKMFFDYFFIKKKLNNPKYTHIYIGSPSHDNLGDHQIRNSSIELLKSMNIKFIEMTYDMYYFYFHHIIPMPYIKTICLQGGGNLGDEYLDDVILRDEIVRIYKDKKIIVFPSSIYFKDESDSGEIQITKKIFSNHKNLFLFARDSKSYEIMKTIFPNNHVKLVPDIVMDTNYTKKYKSKRNNSILFLFRSDREKKISKSTLETIKLTLSKEFKIVDSDTIAPIHTYDIARNKELRKLLKKIAKSSCVITDRLHGMIFSAITSTPCIVTSNYNHKIKTAYNDWLKEFEFIKFCDNINKDTILEEVKNLINTNQQWSGLSNKFDELKKEL